MHEPIRPRLGNTVHKVLRPMLDDVGTDTAATTLLFGREEDLRCTPRISPLPFRRERPPFPVGVVSPLVHGFRYPWYRSLVRAIHHPRRVDPNKGHAMQGKADSSAVAVDQALTLEGMAHYGQLGGPRPVNRPESKNREEDVRIRVQGPLLAVYPRGNALPAGRMRK
jgi:hypothetical protein